MQVNFARKDLNGAQLVAGAVVEVERMEWRAMGGPWKARMISRAQNLERLWGLVDLLRCGVTICDDGGPAWWGYVGAVELHAGPRVMRIDLAGVWNTVLVRYRDDSPNVEGGEEHFSSWATNARSVAEWGTKAKIFEMGKGTAADAAAYAQSLLNAYAWPEIIAWIDEDLAEFEEPYALLEALGWWETLDWQYYTQVRGQSGTLKGSASYNFGTNGVQRLAQRVVSAGADWNASEVWLKLKRFKAADGITLQITSTAAGGTIYATGTLTASLIEDEYTWTRWVLSDPVVMTSSIKYMHIARSGALSDLNYFVASVDEGLSYEGGELVYYSGINWFFRSPDADLSFLITGTEDTGTQIKAMVESGQFFSVCRLDAISSVDGRLYRDGSLRIREEVEKLLQVGQSTGRSSLAFVDRDRVVRIYTRPVDSTAQFSIGAGGEILRADGRPANGSDMPAGCWAMLGDGGAVGALMGYEARVWMGRVTWEGGKLFPEHL